MDKQGRDDFDRMNPIEPNTLAAPKTDTADIFADAPPSTESAPKRERTKDTSPMAQAKLATTQLRVLDARKGRALQAQDKLRQEIESLDARRDAFVFTLSEPVIAILKAGGVL